MNKIIEKELSYKLVGIFFDIQKELGRFCRERQYADVFENKLIKEGINFQREYPIEISGRKSNFVDFVVENKILIDLKAKPFIKKDDYYQMKRYLEIIGFELGLIINLRDEYLKPRRVLNNKNINYSDMSIRKVFGYVDSDKKFVVSDRSRKGQAMLLTVLILGGMILGVSTIVGYLMVLKIRAASDIANSAKAIFAADTGLEWEIYKCFKCNPLNFCDSACTDLDSQKPLSPMSNGSTVNSSVIYDVDGAPQSIKSIGQSFRAYRAFEIGF